MRTAFCGNVQFLAASVRRMASMLCLLALCALNSIAATPAEELLDSPLAQFDVRGGVNAFAVLCDKINISCGEEEASVNDLGGDAALDLTTTTPRHVLDEIIQRHPAYQWTLRDGTLNLEPKKHDGEDVLSRKLDKVSIHGVSSPKAMLDVLHQAKIRFAFQPSNGRGRYVLIDLDQKNITVREALNAIARSNGQMMWMFSLENGERSGVFLVSSRKKSGVLFSKDEREKVKSWLGK